MSAREVFSVLLIVPYCIIAIIVFHWLLAACGSHKPPTWCVIALAALWPLSAPVLWLVLRLIDNIVDHTIDAYNDRHFPLLTLGAGKEQPVQGE